MSPHGRPWNIKLLARTKGYAVTTTWMTSGGMVGSRRYSQVGRISYRCLSRKTIVTVQLDGVQRRLEPGQAVIPHGPDRGLDVAAAAGKQT